MSDFEKAIVFLNDIKRVVETSRSQTRCMVYIPLERAFNLNTAIEALREAAERENPKPLTLEELKAYTKPITIVEKGRLPKWVLPYNNRLSSAYFSFFNINGCIAYKVDQYGEHWLAYGHEPKEPDA